MEIIYNVQQTASVAKDNNMYNKMLKNYWKPTPLKWRKFGDALLAISTFVASFTLYQDKPWIGVVALITGVIGKFLTNFFSK